MCMLSYFQPGCVPNDEHLYNGAESNPDGHGWAIVTTDATTGRKRLMVDKGMDAESTIEGFMDARTRHPDGPAMFHSRIATGGLVDVTGCHPFKVGNDNRTVVGHNGILFAVKGDESDTKIFATRMLPRFGNLDRSKKRRKLHEFIGGGNKLVILTVDPARSKTAYIINERAGNWTGGEWHSNYDWETSWKYGKYASDPISNRAESTCDVCWSLDSVDSVTMFCGVCKCCQDCRQFIENCDCYLPENLKATAQKAITAQTSMFRQEASIPVAGKYVPIHQRAIAAPPTPKARTTSSEGYWKDGKFTPWSWSPSGAEHDARWGNSTSE